MSDPAAAASEPISTLADLAREIWGIDPGRVHAFFYRMEQAAKSLVETLVPMAEKAILRAMEFIKRIEEAPKIDGHEELLVERLNYHPLMARLMAHAVHRFGALYAAEQNDPRRARVIVGWLAKASRSGSLAISRRAEQLRTLIRKGCIDEAVQCAMDRAALRLSLLDLEDLAERASRRDSAACRSLVEVCRRLAPGLPSPDGRPFQTHTAIHAFLMRFLRRFGAGGAYTYDAVHKHDEVDLLTLSTRKALLMPNFRPQSAAALLRSGRIPPL